jgi:hypothetical protein
VFAVLVFVAGLILDTTAVLRLTFGWVPRMWVRAPLETSLGAVAVIAAGWVLFAGRGAETPAPRNGRTKPKSRNVARPAAQRRSAGAARQAAAAEKPEQEKPDADASVDIAPGKRTKRRKPIKTDA